MRRILMLLAVAAMILALTAGPVFGAAREPTDFNGPGEASDVLGEKLEDPTGKYEPELTPDAGENCYGEENANTRKGLGGNPGSLAVPTEFPEGTPNYTGHAVSTLDDAFGEDSGEDPGGEISAVQESARDTLAGAENCEPTDRQ